jgi:hypothetical protein
MKYLIAIFLAALLIGCQSAHLIQTPAPSGTTNSLSLVTSSPTVVSIMPPSPAFKPSSNAVQTPHTNEVVWLWWTNNCNGNPTIFTGVRHTFDLKRWSVYYETNCVQPIDACCITCNLQAEFFQAFNSVTPQ